MPETPRSSKSSSIPASFESGVHLLSVDPGIKNFAYVVLDVNTLTVCCGDTVSVRPWGDDDEQSVVRIVALVKALVDIWHPVRGCVEFQGMSQTLRGIQQATAAAMVALGVPCHIVFPATIKSYYPQLGFRGHAKNKEATEDLVEAMGYGALENHLADAIVQGLYVLNEKNF